MISKYRISDVNLKSINVHYSVVAFTVVTTLIGGYVYYIFCSLQAHLT